MSVRQITDKLASGELTSVKVGGSGAEKEVTTKEVTDALEGRVASNEAAVSTNSGNISASEGNIATNTGNIATNTAGIATNVADIITNTGDIATLDSDKLDSSEAQFVGQDPQPAYLPGTVFYNSAKYCLSYYNDIPDMTVDVALEEIIRVYNDTLVAIPNGAPVYVTGTQGGVATVDLAQADSFATSSVPGLATHEIAVGSFGFITHAGSAGIDMTGYAEGTTLFLSATVAGGFTDVAPDIATKLGMVLVTGSSGSFQVKIASNIALPTIVGVLNNGTGGTTIDGNYRTITGYSPMYSVGIPTDGPTGILSPPTAGLYRLNINFNVAFDDIGNNIAVVDLQLWNVTQNAQALVLSSSLVKNSDACSFSPSFVHDFLVADEDYELRVRCVGATLTAVINQLVTFDLTSVHLRA